MVTTGELNSDNMELFQCEAYTCLHLCKTFLKVLWGICKAKITSILKQQLFFFVTEFLFYIQWLCFFRSSHTNVLWVKNTKGAQ